jgi:hypothetical protein
MWGPSNTFCHLKLSVPWQSEEHFYKVSIYDPVQHVLALAQLRVSRARLLHLSVVNSLLLNKVDALILIHLMLEYLQQYVDFWRYAEELSNTALRCAINDGGLQLL